MKYARQVIGYHGCSVEIADAILAGKDFVQSENDYDWLGRGIYFWEFGPERASDWAKEQAERKGFEPAVVGAYIQLGTCFDLLDTKHTMELDQSYGLYRKMCQQEKVIIPKNTGRDSDLKLRKRDCAVINYHLQLLASGGKEFDTVRGSFLEGGAAFPGSKISKQAHIQIAVRNPACIIGTFRPT